MFRAWLHSSSSLDNNEAARSKDSIPRLLLDFLWLFSICQINLLASNKMASGKTKNIDEIDDIGEMFQAMAALDISCKGLKTLDDMKARVREELHQSVKTPSWTAGQVRILN